MRCPPHTTYTEIKSSSDDLSMTKSFPVYASVCTTSTNRRIYIEIPDVWMPWEGHAQDRCPRFRNISDQEESDADIPNGCSPDALRRAGCFSGVAVLM